MDQGSGSTSSDAESTSADALFAQLQTSAAGLSQEEVGRRLAKYGPNALQEESASPWARFAGYFWGPIPWMIEVAAVLSAVVKRWDDLVIIAVMLVFNAAVGFWQEFKAANALEALKRQLALKARALRDGHWQGVDATTLVPGDIIRLRLGDIVPADAKLLDGDYLSVDQSALTGESLPVTKNTGDVAYSGSVAKQGEMVALVVGTGAETLFGRTARLVESAGAASHFQKAVLTIGDYLIYISLGLVAVLVLVQLLRGAALLDLVQFALILTVASIPVAMPAVLSVTMAVGAVALSRMKAIVSRLESIEEMAGIDLLCSDKTGTLTQNRLTLGEPVLFGAEDAQALILAAALASKEEDADAIDLAILGGLDDKKEALGSYQQTAFTPFDPVSKRTEAQVRGADGKAFKVTKGAPQVILALAGVEGDEAARASSAIDDFAARGFRTLGVARTGDGDDWRFLGIVPLFDPPREDSRDTIAKAREHGIEVKMVTGDNVAIGREIADQLGLGRDIEPATKLFEGEQADRMSEGAGRKIEAAGGFAQVFPEHKYDIVKALQDRGHLVAMTGDGVNDAPALKQADVGIAVSGATDAARAAADLVLTAPGLSVIVNAVEEARRIFERMNSYAIYRVIETIRIMFFMVLAMLVYDSYPITAIMIILLALLNDIPIMAIAKDNTWLDPKPVRWQMHRVLTVATVLGLVGVIETFLLLVIAHSWPDLSAPQIQTIVFLKLSIAGHLTLFVARTRRPMLTRPYPAPLLMTAIFATQALAALIAGFGVLVTAISWTDIGLLWVYCLVWVFIEDAIKLALYRRLSMLTPRHRAFLGLMGRPLHPHGRPPM